MLYTPAPLMRVLWRIQGIVFRHNHGRKLDVLSKLAYDKWYTTAKLFPLANGKNNSCTLPLYSQAQHIGHIHFPPLGAHLGRPILAPPPGVFR